ncbi:MAG: hypothetical protein COY39_00125 [Alphaproteobacteria bacterium CG_4_10_14_0_8_um_filter_37_21]|nr:MAG: hypothetical protein COY39_00125 [Alphaproteobacteria bacterium CG_4_10_14_0_8_um_filter_37_21]
MLHFLKATYALLLPLTFFFPRISVPLLIVITAFILLMIWKQQACFSVRPYLNKSTLPFVYAVLLFFTWSAISCLWAPYPIQSLNSLFAFFALISMGIVHIIIFLRLEHDVQKQLIYALLIGSLITTIIMMTDSFTTSPWSAYKGVNKGNLYAKVAMALSFAGLIGWHYIKHLLYKIIFTMAVVVALLYSDCDAAILAYFSGFFLYFLASIPKLQKPIKIFTSVIVPIFFLLLPFMLSKSGMNHEVILNWNKTGIMTNHSSLHRLVILSDTAQTVAQKPFRGYGYNSAKVAAVNGGNKIFSLFDYSRPEKPLVKSTYQAIHPHNFIMQLWLELGLIGVVLWLILTLLVLNIMAGNLNNYPFLLSVFLCGHIHLLVSIGLWQSWWWALVALITPCILYDKQKKTPQKKEQLS